MSEFVPVEPGHPGFLELLRAAGLPVSDLADGGAEYWCYREDGRELSFGGLAVYGRHGLLRSFVAREKGRGAGGRMLRHLIARARELGLHDLWVLTTSAGGFAAHHGFTRAERGAAPAEITATGQFQTLCPATAVLMTYRLA
jgi:N-acetylglutamate synthase-like GNAT family acetyltransferase